MANPIPYPDGSTLYSSALTDAELGGILQPLVLGMLGLTVSSKNDAVRIKWPEEGAPFQKRTDDICYIGCLLKDDPYDKVRDVFNSPPLGWGDPTWGGEPWGGTGTDTALTEQWTYTRVWEIKFCLYGPNSFDNARAIRSALYQDYFTNALANSNLFPMCEFSQVIRAPELINGQWWSRSDLSIEMYEFVNEAIERQTVKSVEVVLENPAGEIADFTVTGS